MFYNTVLKMDWQEKATFNYILTHEVRGSKSGVCHSSHELYINESIYT